MNWSRRLSRALLAGFLTWLMVMLVPQDRYFAEAMAADPYLALRFAVIVGFMKL